MPKRTSTNILETLPKPFFILLLYKFLVCAEFKEGKAFCASESDKAMAHEMAHEMVYSDKFCHRYCRFAGRCRVHDAPNVACCRRHIVAR